MTVRALRAQIEAELLQLQAIVPQVETLLDLLPQTENPHLKSGLISGIALHLHNFYTGAERVFNAIALDVEEGVPTGADWHRQLLDQMAIALPEVRPPVIRPATQVQLDEFRRFRHVVRSSYAYQLEPERVIALAQKLAEVTQNLTHDCQAFCEGLQVADAEENSRRESDANRYF